MSTPEMTRRGMSFGTLVPFFALAFGLTWGIAVTGLSIAKHRT